jgi:membrane fusion protein (multidrug efflux system)
MSMRYRPPQHPFPVARVARLALPLLVAGLAACSGEQAGPGAAGGFQRPPTPVEVAVASRQPVAEHFHAVGSVEAAETILVTTEIDARVERLPFREGESVPKGALIAQLDDDQLRAEVDRVEALLAQRQSAFARTRQMAAERLAPAQDLDDATAALRVAEADLALVRVRLDKARIVAPFAGVLGARFVSPGAYLRAGAAVARLSEIDEVKVNFSAPERYAPELQVGREVTVSAAAYPELVIAGQVDLVEPSLDAETRSIRARARVPNRDRRLRPGMSADVSVRLAERLEALTVPSEAVFAEGNRFLVYAVKADSTVARLEVALGVRLPGQVEILSGLEAGDRVVRAGHQKLFDGAPVTAVDSAAAAGAATAAAGSEAPEATR